MQLIFRLTPLTSAAKSNQKLVNRKNYAITYTVFILDTLYVFYKKYLFPTLNSYELNTKDEIMYKQFQKYLNPIGFVLWNEVVALVFIGLYRRFVIGQIHLTNDVSCLLQIPISDTQWGEMISEVKLFIWLVCLILWRALMWLNLYGWETVQRKLKNRQKMHFWCF